ncbi:arginyltransferase [Acidihalobacter prosperus]|uniref:Aspartate/glutamate leucyltransferase n=1 Tax=Acidihalobacter prosperus TaxID=160660 RepID=A0A1A6C1X2_9GAMM|nr:arginyltransferase [Acidihalobacter prosperus]
MDVVTDPGMPIDQGTLSDLFRMGFRRSGIFVYRPECPGCQSCIAVRIPVHDFRPNRAQRRCLARNAELTLESRPPHYSDELFRLYRAYLKHRHPGGGMDKPTPDSFREFLCTPGVETEFLLFRAGGRLLSVAVTDRLHDGLSANYTFFAPNAPERSLGTYAILSQVAEARRRGLDYVYLGYWIAESPKMRYKNRFRPLEFYADEYWQRCERPPAAD